MTPLLWQATVGTTACFRIQIHAGGSSNAHRYTPFHKKIHNFTYRTFYKTLPRSSAFVLSVLCTNRFQQTFAHWISVVFRKQTVFAKWMFSPFSFFLSSVIKGGQGGGPLTSLQNQCISLLRFFLFLLCFLLIADSLMPNIALTISKNNTTLNIYRETRSIFFPFNDS